MSEHYYANNPQSAHNVQEFSTELRGREYKFYTDSGVFSKNEVDQGSQLLIETLPFHSGEKILEAGCGYGVIGIVAADLVGQNGFVDMFDINQRAVELAIENIRLNNMKNARAFVSNGFSEVTGKYNWVVTNPPIRAGKKVIYNFVEQAWKHLLTGGKLMLVIRTKQGAKSMAAKMESVFGDVDTVKKEAGFRVLSAQKKINR